HLRRTSISAPGRPLPIWLSLSSAHRHPLTSTTALAAATSSSTWLVITARWDSDRRRFRETEWGATWRPTCLLQVAGDVDEYVTGDAVGAQADGDLARVTAGPEADREEVRPAAGGEGRTEVQARGARPGDSAGENGHVSRRGVVDYRKVADDTNRIVRDPMGSGEGPERIGRARL